MRNTPQLGHKLSEITTIPCRIDPVDRVKGPSQSPSNEMVTYLGRTSSDVVTPKETDVELREQVSAGHKTPCTERNRPSSKSGLQPWHQLGERRTAPPGERRTAPPGPWGAHPGRVHRGWPSQRLGEVAGKSSQEGVDGRRLDAASQRVACHLNRPVWPPPMTGTRQTGR